MTREEVLQVWAPSGGAWSLWVRPVLFAQMPEGDSESESGHQAGPAPVPSDAVWGLRAVVSTPATAAYMAARGPHPPESTPPLRSDAPLDTWPPPPDRSTLLVLDLPGAEAVHLGLALARHGYRPVPLYNGCTGSHEAVEQGYIQRALREGAGYLRALALPADAPPAFLLDCLRQAPMRPLRPGTFDNRWWVYPEDFPSAELLRERGYRQVVLVQRGRQPQDDLRLVLSYWQEAGLAIATKDPLDAAPPRALVMTRPNWARRLWERVLRSLGIRRGSPGGFGYTIPQPRHG